jgi:hypothetical protein
MTFLQGGNVGIGTSPTSPNSVNRFLHIHNADHSSLVMSDDQNTWEIVSNNNLTIRDGTDTRLTVDTSGNVGIATAAPARALEINGGGYNQLMIASNASSNTNKLAGIESRNYSNYALGLLQMFANSSQTGLYHGSADSSAKGVTDHYFMTSPSKDSSTNNTVMKLTSARNVEITDGNLSFASGHGIDFANTSTQTGNTSVSHLFNDYEHGDFTPSLSHSYTCDVRTGRYVRVGDLVHFVIQIGNNISNITSGNQFTVEGLPFPVYAANAAGSCFARYIDEPDNVVVYVTTNEALHLYSSGSGSWGSLYYSNLNSVSAYFYIHGSYRTT